MADISKKCPTNAEIYVGSNLILQDITAGLSFIGKKFMLVNHSTSGTPNVEIGVDEGTEIWFSNMGGSAKITFIIQALNGSTYRQSEITLNGKTKYLIKILTNTYQIMSISQ